MDDIQSDRDRLKAIRLQRAQLIDQIRECERVIEQSRELLKKLDKILAEVRGAPSAASG
jgi:hypothetical protein